MKLSRILLIFFIIFLVQFSLVGAFLFLNIIPVFFAFLTALIFTLVIIVFLRYIYNRFTKRKDLSEKEFSLGIPILDKYLSPVYSSIRENITLNNKKEYERGYKALQSQINPHFLYNTIDSIRGMALINDQTEIADLLESLSTFFRYHISRKGDFVSIADELENIDAYMEIQTFRFKEKLFLIKSVNDIDTDMYYIPKLIIQPLIENAIYHGIEQMEGSGILQINIDHTSTKILIEIKDNGEGMVLGDLESLNQSINSYRKGESGKGYALKNINTRIKSYFGSIYGMTIYSEKGEGTRVELTVPKLLFDDILEIEE